ncbi:unnamed protein product [Rhizophagus irregularis]|nr:unnamed protein product [Rhizophagus irregularis]
MSNAINNSRARKRAKRREFKPREPYTHRLRKILEEYPDGSQVLREILQNSDDAKSTEQIFILDHNTYPSDSLFEPDLVNNYERTNLKLDRYQGPALLAKNNTIFKERDFQSLLKLADSEKRDQFDKIGVMGVGFNSIYHITDSPSFITGDKYVILDPHEWYFDGGVQFDFVEDKLAKEYPDQFAPFRTPCNKPYEGTIFRYPLRTDEDSTDSDISKKVYKPEEILDIFQKFYENESINCLLFLKYVECISFYELKEGSTEPELLYMIKLENAGKVRKQRRLIVENIVSMMNKLQSKTLGKNNQLQATYVASFSRQQKGDCKNISSWLILNYLDDLNEAEAYFQDKFNKNIVEYKFVPNVGLAIPLGNLNVTGRLFCFLPLPISMPFRVSVHGYFAVSTNRRSLWSTADNEDLAADALARIKVAWNRYLFEIVLPKAWVTFLRELPLLKATNIKSSDFYKIWPIKEDTPGSSSTSSVISNFCKDLLQNVANCLNVDDRVFKGPSSSNNVGTVSGVSESYNVSSYKGSEFYWLSLSNGYFEDEKWFNYDLTKILGNIGFPVISVFPDIMRVLKNSKHKDSFKTFSPAVIRTYLDCNRARWENTIPRKEVLELFNYILRDKNFDELVGFKMIPLADGTLDTITQSSNSCVYICPDDDIKDKIEKDKEKIHCKHPIDFILPCGHVLNNAECWKEENKEEIHCKHLIDIALPCGHVLKNAECWQIQEEPTCMELVTIKLPTCEHCKVMNCTASVDNAEFKNQVSDTITDTIFTLEASISNLNVNPENQLISRVIACVENSSTNIDDLLETEELPEMENLETDQVTKLKFNRPDLLNTEVNNSIFWSDALETRLCELYMKDDVVDIFWGRPVEENLAGSTSWHIYVITRGSHNSYAKTETITGNQVINFIAEEERFVGFDDPLPSSLKIPHGLKENFNEVLDNELGLSFREAHYNLVGVGTGYKQIRGQFTETPAIIFYVRQKGILRRGCDGLLPKEIRGFPTDVIEACVAIPCVGIGIDTCRRHQKNVTLGSSIGIGSEEAQNTTGTLSAIAYKNSFPNQIGIISCEHVLKFNESNQREKITIYQPSYNDHFEPKRLLNELIELSKELDDEYMDEIMELTKKSKLAESRDSTLATYVKGMRKNFYSEIHKKEFGVDAGFCVFDNENRKLYSKKFPIRSNYFENAGLSTCLEGTYTYCELKNFNYNKNRVFKVGRTTGLTIGQLLPTDQAIAYQKIFIGYMKSKLDSEIRQYRKKCYPIEWFDRQLAFKFESGDFDCGDSGASVIDETGKALGILHAKWITPYQTFGIASPYFAILEALDVSIYLSPDPVTPTITSPSIISPPQSYLSSPYSGDQKE